jgi:putative membrane protein
MREQKILASAEFDSRLPTYFLLQHLLALLVCVVTIPLMPIWALLGQVLTKKQYEALGCDLTERSLHLRGGVLFKVQKTIPLDKITDLAVNEGPVLRYLGLCSLKIETAGGGQESTMGQAQLAGVVDALEFRDKVLVQRDLVSGGIPAPAPSVSSSDPVLVDIRDTLHRIEQSLVDSSQIP